MILVGHNDSIHLESLHDLQLLDPVLITELAVHALHKVVVTRGQSGVRGDTVVVLSGQDTNLQRAEDGKTKAVVFVEGEIILLNTLARKHVVLWLFHYRPDHVELVCDAPCSGDFVGIPFRGTPVKGFSGVNYVVEGTDCLFDWCVTVGSMGVD